MKKSTKNKSIIAAIAAVMAIASMSSCSNDSPSCFNALPGQGLGAAEATTSAKAATHHIGDTIKKHIEGYGDAVFTCISSKAPFYFIHTSDRKYSAKEMDAMHYQQNPLAVDKKMLNNIADIAIGDWATNYANKSGVWNAETIAKYKEEFKKVFTEEPLFEYSRFHKRSDDRIGTQKFWIRSTGSSYPKGRIALTLKNGQDPIKSVTFADGSTYIFTLDYYMMFAFTE